MASSRIFVRGLPPTLSEDEFRKHFSSKHATTDVKFFQHRRIGYVGYKSPEDAANAVKYFNKTFMRMSKIYVELARPVSEEKSRPQRNQSLRNPANRELVRDESATNELKRKRPSEEPAPSDPKLQEYLEIMQPPSKVKRTLDTRGHGAPSVAETKPSLKSPDAGESDDEYQEVKKTVKRDRKEEGHAISKIAVERPVQETGNDSAIQVGDVESSYPSASLSEEVSHSGPVSDSDWLRSRTRRLPDLDSDEENDPTGDVDPGDEDSLPEVPAQPADELQPEASHGVEARSNEITGRLFVRNLPYDVSEDDLRELFSQHGKLNEVHVPLDPKSGTGKGFAYVDYADADDAKSARETRDGTIFQGRLLHVIPAAPKRESKLDEYALSKLPLKKQNQIKKKAEAGKSTFNWNALYMNTDSIMSSVADRLGISKSELLDPTSSDAAIKQAHAETHVIAETKAYFAQNGVDLDAFKSRQRGDTAILVKNFSYGTKLEELRTLFEEHGTVKRILMPPSGTIAIVEFSQAPQARAAFSALAYRKFKDSVLFLEKAPKDLFKASATSSTTVVPTLSGSTKEPNLSATDLLEGTDEPESIDTATLFVRNLNFKTTTGMLTEAFKPLDGFTSAVVRTKTDPKDSSKRLSMGYGFVEFRSKAQAQAALAAMQDYSLDGYKLLIKASHKGHDAAEERRREDKAKKAASKQTKIIIKNLPFEATKKDVRALFGAYGQLRSVRVPKKFDRSARGFAFADFISAREAENAMDALRNTHLLGRKLVLDFAANEPEDAEEELEKMQQKVGSQINKVALHKLTAPGRKKFNVGNEDPEQD